MPRSRSRFPSRWARHLLLPLAALAVQGSAHAEIYGWVDTDGSFTYSNLPPPKGARVTDVIPEASPPARIPSSELSHQAELAALNDRIRLLELERSRGPGRAVDFPPPPQYLPPPAPVSYGYGCDALDVDCGAYAVPYVVYGGAPVYYYGGRYAARRGSYPGMAHGHAGRGGGGYPAHASVSTPGHGAGSRR